MANDTLPRDNDGQLSKYAWPGGYPIYYLDNQNSVLCADCARKDDGNPDAVFKVTAADVNYESTDLYCDDCSKPIESAYSDDSKEQEQN